MEVLFIMNCFKKTNEYNKKYKKLGKDFFQICIKIICYEKCYENSTEKEISLAVYKVSKYLKMYSLRHEQLHEQLC